MQDVRVDNLILVLFPDDPDSDGKFQKCFIFNGCDALFSFWGEGEGETNCVLFLFSNHKATFAVMLSKLRLEVYCSHKCPFTANCNKKYLSFLFYYLFTYTYKWHKSFQAQVA